MEILTLRKKPKQITQSRKPYDSGRLLEKFRSIEKGAAQTHFGTGHFQNFKWSTIAGVNGNSETKLAFSWGGDTYYQRPQFQIDSSGNIYILNREKDVVGGGQNMWNFETVKISYDEFYVHDVNGQNTGVRKASPITHNSILIRLITHTLLIINQETKYIKQVINLTNFLAKLYSRS